MDHDLSGTPAEEAAWAEMQSAIERYRADPTAANRMAVTAARHRLDFAMTASIARLDDAMGGTRRRSA